MSQPITQPASATEQVALVHALGVKDTVGVRLSREDIEKPGYEDAYDFVWLHFDVNAPGTREWIERQSCIPVMAARALLAGETRPRIQSFDDSLVLNLRGVNLNEGADPADMVSIRIWMDARHVVTTRRRLVKSIQDIRMEVEKPGGPADPGALVALLAAKLTLRMDPYIVEIADAVDALEDEILSGQKAGMREKLADTRHNAVLLRRYIAPQRDVLNRLAIEETPLFDHRGRSELREIADMVTRMTEEIDAARERAIVLQDQLTDQRAEEMNRNMMILSVVAAIFLPLGFLTGLLGINVGGIPGAENPLAFLYVVIIMLAIAGGLMFYFHRKGWL